MSGRKNALLAVVIFSALFFVLPPLVASLTTMNGLWLTIVVVTLWLVGGTISLVTLRLGLWEGSQIMLAAIAAFSVGVMLFQQSIRGSLPYILITFVPIWLLANSLRTTGTQWGMLKSAITFMVIIYSTLYLMGYDMVAIHHTMVDPLLKPGVIADVTEATIKFMRIAVFPSFVAMLVLSLWIMSVCIGRWWQALLFNPGGFQQEFHQLRISKNVAIPAAILAWVISSQSGTLQYFAADIFILLTFFYWLGGVALVHSIAGNLRLHWSVYLIFYPLNIIPPMQVIVAGAGFFDSWFNFREKFNSHD